MVTCNQPSSTFYLLYVVFLLLFQLTHVMGFYWTMFLYYVIIFVMIKQFTSTFFRKLLKMLN